MRHSTLPVFSWRAILLTVIVGIVATASLVGCSTTASLPPHIAMGLEGLRTEAVSLRGQIEKTVGALNELMTKPQADLSPQFQSYSHELGILENRLEEARQQRAATDAVVKDQFMVWDETLKQLQHEDTQARAAERRAATEATYSGITQKIAEVKKEWTPFYNDLRDIRQYLTSDLSKEGLHTIEPSAQRVFDQKNGIIQRLDEFIEGLDSAISTR